MDRFKSTPGGINTKALAAWAAETELATSAEQVLLPHKQSTIRGIGTPLIDGRYRLGHCLGSGAMGVVYLAHDVGLDRRVALKVLSAEHADDEQAVASLQHEARSLAALRHPNVVGVHACGRRGGMSFFVMDYVEGTDLETIIESHSGDGTTMQLERALTILGEISAGLAAVHAAGLVHRDVKPTNIMIERDTERTVLVDFGLADVVFGRDVIGGTPAYSSLEQLLGAPSSPAFDIYAFGVVAFELLTGRLPFVAASLEHLIQLHKTTPVPKLSSVVPKLAPLDHVIVRALHRYPQARHATVTDLYADLVKAAKALLTPSRAPKPQGPSCVLLIEPPGARRELLRRAVNTAFFWQPVELRSVATLDEAFVDLATRRPDLVIIDNGTAGGEGADFLSALCALPDGDTIPVVAVTDQNDSRGIVEAIERTGTR